MARIRTVKPEFADSESMARVSRDARLLFVIMWTIADDDGRLRGAPRFIASKVFPYDDDAPELVDGWLTELEREGCIRRYVADGSRYIEVVNWEKHQKIEKRSPSRLPASADVSAASPRPVPDDSPTSPRLVVEDSRPDLVPRTMDLGTETTPPTPRKRGKEPEGDQPGGWQTVEDWVAQWFGPASVQRRNGRPRAFVGQLCAAVGPKARDDPAAARTMLDAYHEACIRDGSWQYVTTGNLVERVGKWLASEPDPGRPRAVLAI